MGEKGYWSKNLVKITNIGLVKKAILVVLDLLKLTLLKIKGLFLLLSFWGFFFV
jgi:hypothetical protein